MGFGRGLAPNIARIALILPVVAALAVFAAMAPTATPKAEAYDGDEASFLSMINDYRAQNGLGPLAADDSLNNVARWMAGDLAANNYFSHTDSLGRDPFVRMDQLGYAYNTWRGENLVAGTETAAHAMQMWKDSPPHNENMLNPNYTVIGIARAYDATSDFGWYWATEFGGASSAPPPPAPAPQPTQEPAPYIPPAQPAPTQNVAPPPAPTASPEPSPTPAPTPTPAPASDAAWWHSVSALESSWTMTTDVKPGSHDFVKLTVFGPVLPAWLS